MKKAILVVAGAMFLMASCGNKKKECDSKCEKAKTEQTMAVATSVVEGVYEGTFPCADCSGIATKLELKAGGVFEKHQEYLEKESGNFDMQGAYVFDAESGKLSLEDANGEKEVFLLQADNLMLLDVDGNPVEAYVLTKK